MSEKQKPQNADLGGETVEVIEGLLAVVDALMPGLRYIAVQDYAAVNDVPIRAARLLRRLRDGKA